jgi:chromosome segregation ATPase
MPAPTNLKELHQQRVTRLESARDAARAELSAAQAALAASGADRAGLASQQAALTVQVERTRQAMAEAPLPADVEALAAELRTLLTQVRRRRWQLLEADEALAAAAARASRAAAELEAAAARLQAAQADLAAAAERHQRHQAWTVAVSAPPLSTLPAEAGAALAGTAFAQARARVEGDVPAKLRQRAAARGAEEGARLGRRRAAALDSEDQLLGHRAAGEGLPGASAEAGAGFRRAEAALRDFALEGKRRYDRALAALAAIPASAPLTQAQRDHIEDAALQADREAAADAEKERDEARAEVEAKRAELDAKVREAVAADVDADPAADPAVAALEGELAALRSELGAKEAAFTAALRDAMDEWEASVPDAIWQNLASLEDGKKTLEELQAAAPAALVAALGAAQGALVAALLAEDRGARTRRVLEAGAQQAAELLVRARDAHSQRFLAALRGDP